MNRSDAISYALSRHVPDMDRGFILCTRYGELEIDAADTQAFIQLTKNMLLKQLAKAAAEASAQDLSDNTAEA